MDASSDVTYLGIAKVRRYRDWVKNDRNQPASPRVGLTCGGTNSVPLAHEGTTLRRV